MRLGTSARAAALALATLVLVAAYGGLAHPSGGASASLGAASRSPGELRAVVKVGAGPLPLDAHVGLLSRGVAAPSTVYYFADPDFPVLYGTPVEVFGGMGRLQSYLESMSPGTTVRPIDAAGFAGVVADHPGATVVELGTGVVPSSVLSVTSTALSGWLQDGGTLIWAGGPLGYFGGEDLPGGGFAYDNLLWSGENDLAGWSVTDPIPNPYAPYAPPGEPTFGTNLSVVGRALGVSFLGSYFGANTSALPAHGGVALGFSGPGLAGEAPRTSLAWLPVGRGGIFYFGAGTFIPGAGAVPYASVDLDHDVALLIALGYRPGPDPPVYLDLAVPAASAADATLVLSGPPGPATVFVESDLSGSLLFFWQAPIAAALPAGDGVRRGPT